MKTLRYLVLSIVSAFAAAGVAHAQLSWTKINVPDTISLFSLGSDGSLYVASGTFVNDRRLYYSGDRGSHWIKIHSGSINLMACDSNGAIIITSDSIRYSLDHGMSWVALSAVPNGIEVGGIGCTRSATYLLARYYNTLYRNSRYEPNWIKFSASLGEIDDLKGLWCGTPDRILAGLQMESFWLLLDSFSVKHDMMCDLQGFPITDNTPPRSFTFGKDGYLYVDHFGFMRLPPSSLQWDCYDMRDTSWYTRAHHFPYSSIDATQLISVDTGGTWTSIDHGSNWTRIGTGLPNSWFLQVTFDSKDHGYALTDSGLFVTNFFAGVNPAPTNKFGLDLYPNPCASTLSVGASGVCSVQIIDALGRTREQFTFTGYRDNPELDVRALPAGVYYVLAESGGGRVMATFVKQ